MPPSKARSRTRTARRTAVDRIDASNAPVLRQFKKNFRWGGVALEAYKTALATSGEFRGASRQVLIGSHDEQVKFHLRYFELEPGGFTSLEHHRHSHVVVGLRGRGRVRVGDHDYVLKPMDTVYIAPNMPHQLRGLGRNPFGFFCIVDAKRDRPRPISGT